MIPTYILVLLPMLGSSLCMKLHARSDDNIQILHFEAFNENEVNAELVVCPDGGICPDLTTCCIMVTGAYGCCPYIEGVCCSDLTHCCPTGYICNVANGTCSRGNAIMNWQTQIAAKQPVDASVKCKDGSECPAENTCCELATGQYGCCPLPEATCCSDHAHCCPHGYKCDVAAGTCTKGNDILNWLTKVASKSPIDTSVKCKDGSECPAENTCCELATGQYGCCPLPEATCCSDHAHCCPHGYKCDVAAGTCTKGNDIFNWLTKVASKPPVDASVTCKDGSECPAENTCCELATGQYGCCPLPEAVCCSDHAHCCPHGYKCDVAAGTCTKGRDILSWLPKTPAKFSDSKINDSE